LRNLHVGENLVHIYYFPNLNEDEAAICAFGHHILQDGLTQMQSYHKITDEGRDPKTNDYFPFMDRKPVTFL